MMVTTETFRSRILHAKDLSAGELRALQRFFQAAGASRPEGDDRLMMDNRAFMRVRAIYLMKVWDKTAEYVSGELEISLRQVWRWLSWYSAGGLRGLLNESQRLYGQCSTCRRLFARRSHPWRCSICDRERQASIRETATGSLITRRYREGGGQRRANNKYRHTERGRLCREREVVARALAEARKP